MIHKFFIAIACLIAVSLLGETSFAQHSEGNLANPIFSQFTTQGGASSATAGAYPAPHPVPQNVGATYYTYQPLMPHEHMHVHSRNYFNYYNDSSYPWQNGNSGQAPFGLSNQWAQKLQYKFAERAYGINGCPGGDCGGIGLGGIGGGGGLGGHFGGGLGGHFGGGHFGGVGGRLGAARLSNRLRW